MKKVLVVIGTRPEAIKMAPVYHALKNCTNEFSVYLCATGQHKEMVDQVMDFFDMRPDYYLNAMGRAKNLSNLTSGILDDVYEVINNLNPDFVFVHGDTTTAFSAALAAFYNTKKVVHIEAGLRTFDITRPYPEELNRQLISKIAWLHFSPTNTNKNNLINENINEANTFVVGNTVIDALLFAEKKISENIDIKYKIEQLFCEIIDNEWKSKKLVTITGHRRENFGDGLIDICSSIKKLAKKYKDVIFVYPVHLNPNVKNVVYKLLDGVGNVKLISPLDYVNFVYLLKCSYIVMTDSGGVQEEAPSLGKPVLVMRDVTERIEAVNAGTVKLVGTNPEKIFNEVSLLLDNKDEYIKMTRAKNPYGDGFSAIKITKIFTDKIS